MNNADTSIYNTGLTQEEMEGIGNRFHQGLTKREQFCLQMGVPETGDPELDDIIRKGNEQKIATMVTPPMEIIIKAMTEHSSPFTIEDYIMYAAAYKRKEAEKLLKELNK